MASSNLSRSFVARPFFIQKATTSCLRSSFSSSSSSLHHRSSFATKSNLYSSSSHHCSSSTPTSSSSSFSTPLTSRTLSTLRLQRTFSSASTPMPNDSAYPSHHHQQDQSQDNMTVAEKYNVQQISKSSYLNQSKCFVSAFVCLLFFLLSAPSLFLSRARSLSLSFSLDHLRCPTRVVSLLVCIRVL
ncbi:hypothetical protein EDD21DRAFT_85325 [Dissophora ornata]|nr:hypothetical protein EDD21DRAFT_85325 [Dissophora ornata]